MKIEYDPEADARYIQIRAVHPRDTIDIEDGVTVDVGKEATLSASRSSMPADD